MKKIASALFLVASMALMALPASADSYTLTFTGGTNPPSGGPYEIFPYNFTVTNTTDPLHPQTQTGVQMMCIDFNREITTNETWTATLVNITASPLPGDAQTAKNLKIEAVLASEIAALDTHAANYLQTLSDLQYAVWSLTATSTQILNAPGQFDTASQTDLTNATTEVTNGTSGLNFANYSYFDPVTWPGSPGGNDPQRFLVFTPNVHPNVIPPVPEPSSLMLLGTGVLGLASVARRRLLKA